MVGPLVVSLLVSVAVLLGFIGVWRVTATQDPVAQRLERYGDTGLELEMADSDGYTARRRRGRAGGGRLGGLRFSRSLATSLVGADISLRVTEFILIVLGAGLVGFIVGMVRGSVLLGIGLAAIGAYLPIIWLRLRVRRRQRAMTEQLPDFLTLLVGALRAGYGLTQALEMLVEQTPPPTSVELGRVMRAVGLGLPVQQALSDMAERVGTDDVELVVTAVTVQYDMGGNLAETLEVIGETVRDRIRMKREIRVLTAQQRMTGYVLAVLPIAVGFGMYAINPVYFMGLFGPGWIRFLPIAAVVMQVIGFIVIRRIVDIEV
jgi:tight adherence protein B